MAQDLAQLLEDCSWGDPQYRDRYMHAVPAAPSVEREKAILGAVRGKVVLDIGYAGSPLHEAVRHVAARVYGVDCTEPQGAEYFKQDLNYECIVALPDIQMILCGEVIEHLSNPGSFLDGLRRNYQCPLLLTVPNAFCSIGQHHMKRGFENVNLGHVAWYSWRTIKTLLERHGWSIDSFYWYGGTERFSEGLLVLAR